MTTDTTVEAVRPADVTWLTAREIQVESLPHKDIFSFYGSGPDDRITVVDREKVRRKNDVSDDGRAR
ncbi:hypothetical protein MTY66_34640 [Mycolicibacterium sp. TY66]|uniref:hypothetical protein n=1 Tax=unclassified Mycolicibacterium TaxID=2636767 RepID=UPI001BB41C7E|nr:MULTISPECIES: hypothetical protein [unclassified Mycolicibacterium]BCI81839.1 hypothetical protein MTY66_34640 [Mycolicibacterium sp. TY66]BCJ80512.1 hypothetical protein MTY81_18850 [Mycolicibacterium sp. TY81]